MPGSLLESLIVEPWLGLSRRVTHGFLRAWLNVPGRPGRGAAPAYESVAGSLLYVAASALPYHITGYATRTHEINRALLAAGARVRVLTRPGYPWDRADRGMDAVATETWVDEVRYGHVPYPRNRWPVMFYAVLAARGIAKAARRHRAAAIHAASNHVNALPALLAARQLGISFQYEMRGLWELTRISRMPDYEGSQAYRQGLQLEGLVARSADRLFVISDQLGRYMVAHYGVDASRMALLPNCVDPDRFAPADPGGVRADTLGYAGSLIGYEGLDTLISALHGLAARGHPVSLTVIGDGEARPALEEQVAQLGLEARVRFLGKMPPGAARSALAGCAVVCIPRRPFTVCKIVPPIKLAEALAMGKPVIVPDLPVFRDELGDEPPGWFFKAGDAVDLARVVRLALEDATVLANAGARARNYVCTRRSWRDFVGRIIPADVGKGKGY